MMYLGNDSVGLNNSSVTIIDNAMPKWEYINTIQVDEDVDTIFCTSDISGSPITLRGFAIIIYSAPSDKVTGNANIYIGVLPINDGSIGTSSTYEVAVISAGIRTSAQENFCWGTVDGILNDARSSIIDKNTDFYTMLIDIGGTTDSFGGRRAALSVSSQRGDGYIHGVYAQGKYFGPGSFIRVYGIRA